MNVVHKDKIIIIDFGSQYTQLIARRVRDSGVYCEIYPYDIEPNIIADFSPKGVILSGGPESVSDDMALAIPDIIFQLACPILGICYGMQAMAMQLGGKVESSQYREFGHATVDVQGDSLLFDAIADKLRDDGTPMLDVWMSHGDRVATLPTGFSMIASTSSAPIAAMADVTRHYYGVQFHPEVTHTRQGKQILARFVHDICHCQALWTSENIIDNSITAIQEKIGSDKVLLGLSGGVDSSVVAALLHRAIGKQLICVFVDTGLLRLNEAEQVLKTFSEHMGITIIHVEAQAQFMTALAGVTDPEAKRKIIGAKFIDVFQQQAQQLQDVKWLAQGTIYPDVIESASQSKSSHVIKSHHNVGGLPENMPFQLLEPIRELFKDEVRTIGLALGLPYEMLYRHPFPGPGLGVRILGEVKQAYADILRLADNIFIEELYASDHYHKVSQAFAVFLPVKSVGVIGDARQYEYVIALRAVETVDFMTARWAHLPYQLLEKVSNRIINEVVGISRVTYDISSKPPATIEWE